MFMEKENNKEKKENDKGEITDLGEQIKRLKTLVTTGFDVASTMMDKAIEMLKDGPALLEPVLPKRDFLKTMATFPIFSLIFILTIPISPSAFGLISIKAVKYPLHHFDSAHLSIASPKAIFLVAYFGQQGNAANPVEVASTSIP